MQLSTSFLPFDVAPAAAPATAVPTASAPSQSASGDFDAILTSEATVSSPPRGGSAANVVDEPVSESSGDEVAIDAIVANDPNQPAQAPAIATSYSWSGFMTPPDASAAEGATSSAEAVNDSDSATDAVGDDVSVPSAARGITAENQRVANAPSNEAQVQTFVAATAAPARATPPANSTASARADAPTAPATAPSRAPADETFLDSSRQSLPSAEADVAKEIPKPREIAGASGSAATSEFAQQVRGTGTSVASAASNPAPAADARKAESLPSTKSDTPSAETSSTTSSPEPEQFAANNAAASRSSQATPATPRDPSTLNGAVSSERPSSAARDAAVDADATSSAVSENRVRTVVDSARAASRPGAAERARVSDHAVARAVTEKFAAPSARREGFVEATSTAPKKESLAAVYQQVGEHVSVLGTNVAKAEDHMSPSTSIAAPAQSIERLSHAMEPASFDAAFAEGGGGESTELAQVARRAVNAAMEITEQFAAGEKNHVTLKFSISGSELGVRVELRGEQVHTTFRTDSPELRAALAQEWNVVNPAPTAGDRTSRLAEPVFASNSSAGAAGSDTSGADQRGSQARQSPFAGDEFARYRTASRASDSAAASVSTPVSRTASPVAPGRLHTFA